MVSVGFVGCGAIGSQVATALQRRYSHVVRISALHDCDPARAHALRQRLRPRPPVTSLAGLLRTSQLVIEAASVDAAGHVVRQALRARRDVLVMSVGALLQNQGWRALLKRSGRRLYIPSGALAGLDGIKALALGRLQRVSLTSRKPPRALAEAPFVRRRKLRLERLTRPSTLFEGSAREAIRAFPQNTNVAATLALALTPDGGTGPRIRVRVVADPTIRQNCHDVDLEGRDGRLQCRIYSRPSRNPKTSALAAQSAIAMLGRLFAPISIGT